MTPTCWSCGVDLFDDPHFDDDGFTFCDECCPVCNDDDPGAATPRPSPLRQSV